MMVSRALGASPPETRSNAWLLALLLAATACSDSGPSEPMTTPPSTSPAAPHASNPLAGASFYVDPSNSARQTAEAWRTTRPADAALLARIGSAAQAAWFGGWNADVRAAVATVANAAGAAGQLPVLVAYNIPQRDCGSYSAGGAGSADGYRAWIRDFAAGLTGRRAVVILEPDALAGMDCLNAADRNTRVSLLAEAIRVFKASPTTFVYLDGGHSRWHSAAVMAERLNAANVGAADGFSLNVSNFIGSDETSAYGSSVSALLSGKHFVIDTSRNGVGSNGEWCNPAGRGLGLLPTTATGHPLVDAVLWVKRPGESDGTCNGGPSAGSWWADYALGLAMRATTANTL